eukprot:jgi/Mesvir1/20452/Mv12348-RA.1
MSVIHASCSIPRVPNARITMPRPIRATRHASILTSGFPSKVARGRTRVTTCQFDDFHPEDFTILQRIGQMTMLQSAKIVVPDPLMPFKTVETPRSGAAVNFYLARYESRQPYAPPEQRVLLKEYTARVRDLGKNEVKTYDKILEVMEPSRTTPGEIALPMVAVLGCFESLGIDLEGEGGDGAVTDAMKENVSLWVVQPWTGLMTMADYPSVEQERGPRGGFEIFFPFKVQENYHRFRFLKSLMYQTLDALAKVHRCGIAHRSIGSASVLLNTMDDRLWSSLRVKLTNFGLSVDIAQGRAGLDATTLEEFREEDLKGNLLPALLMEDVRVLGLAFMELVLSALTRASAPSDATRVPALTRLVEGVFSGDMEEVRSYCTQDEDWSVAVDFLDCKDPKSGEASKAGWALLDSMINKKMTAQELLASGTFWEDLKTL